MAVIGYARVSTKYQEKNGNSLNEQEQLLKKNGCEIIHKESYTGTKINRPILDEVIAKLNANDTLMVTKLDRIARTAEEGIGLVRNLVDKKVHVHILNMGIANNTSMGKLMITIMSGFAEFERDMIIERTQAGKEIARKNPNFREGRPKKFTKSQLDLAMELLKKK